MLTCSTSGSNVFSTVLVLISKLLGSQFKTVWAWLKLKLLLFTKAPSIVESENRNKFLQIIVFFIKFVSSEKKTEFEKSSKFFWPSRNIGTLATAAIYGSFKNFKVWNIFVFLIVFNNTNYCNDLSFLLKFS